MSVCSAPLRFVQSCIYLDVMDTDQISEVCVAWVGRTKVVCNFREGSHVKRSNVSVIYSIVRVCVRFLRVRCGDTSPKESW